MKLIKYPDIGQFRNCIKNVQHKTYYVGKDENGEAIMNRSLPLPTLKLKGTVKIHGTNFAVCMDNENNVWTQSRERILSVESDNFGSCFFVEKNKELIENILNEIKSDCPEFTEIVIFGEMAGKGINSNVAVVQLEKFVSIFNILIINDEERTWLGQDEIEKYIKVEYNSNRLFNIFQFGTYEVECDFNEPSYASAKIAELVYQVEENCMVAKFFFQQNTGIDNIAEIIDHKNVKYRNPIPEFKTKEITDYFLSNFSVGDRIEFDIDLIYA